MENTTRRLKITRRPSKFCKNVFVYKKGPTGLILRGLRQPNGRYEVHYRLDLNKRPGPPWYQSENWKNKIFGTIIANTN